MALASTPLRTQIDEHGYVVVPDVVPRPNLEAVIADLWRHTEADPEDRESWYRPGLVASTGMVEMYHYQSLWDNRQHPRVHAVFGEILGTERLWVSLDRANLKPPANPRHPEYDHKGFIHWDVDVRGYPDVPFGVQGVLALADTGEEMGGFQCVPELYRDLGTWLAARAGQEITRRPDLGDYAVTRVPLKAGDMVIWSTLLPHGNGHNTSDRPRLAQYITMSPAREDDEEARQTRIRCWEQRLPPPSAAFPGDPRRIEEREGRPATLTPLGRRLLGLDRWA